MPRKKPNPELAQAEATLELLQKRHSELLEQVERVKDLVHQAHQLVHQARIAADEKLPRANVVIQPWRGGASQPGGSVVILRKTPTGRLVVRPVGLHDAASQTYEWSERNGAFYQKTSRKDWFLYDSKRLTNVPAEFMPAKEDAQ